MGKDKDVVKIEPISLLDRLDAIELSIEYNTILVKNMGNVTSEVLDRLAKIHKEAGVEERSQWDLPNQSYEGESPQT